MLNAKQVKKENVKSRYLAGKKIISFITLALIVSSCGNQVSILKRHYTKGFYVQNNKNAGKTSIAKRNIQSAQPEKMEPLAPVFLKDKQVHPELSARVKNNISLTTNKKISYQSQLKKHVVTVTQSVVEKKILKENISISGIKKEQAKSGASGVELLILIILCFFPFINLIPVFLHDGKSITMNFWICLILDILFFLPGIIFALLVVLDVVNLA